MIALAWLGLILKKELAETCQLNLAEQAPGRLQHIVFAIEAKCMSCQVSTGDSGKH